jgi:hypothetical protein
MFRDGYRYRFGSDVPLEEVRSTLVLAMLSTESLHGSSVTTLEAAYRWVPDERTCDIEAEQPAGRDLNRIFHGFLRREFRTDQYSVERLFRRLPSAATSSVSASAA